MAPPLPCILCGAKSTTKEHAFPAWISKRLGTKTFLDAVATAGDVTPSKQPISIASHRRKILCADCQTHCKHLEDRAIPIVEPMAKDARVLIGRDERAILAEWGAKTAYTLIALEPDIEDAAPEAHRYHLRQTGEPELGIWIGYGGWDGPTTKAVTVATLSSGADEQLEAYQVIAAFGTVLLYVFGLREPVDEYAFREANGVLQKVWPHHDGVTSFPPPFTLRDPNLPELISYIPIVTPSFLGLK